jgi:hypothetical protein
MSPYTRPPFPVEGDLQTFLRNLKSLTSTDETNKIIAAVEETVELIGAQRAVRPAEDTGWFMSSHTALKYYAIKLNAAKVHLDILNGTEGPPGGTAAVPGDLWIVTTQKCVTGLNGLPVTVLTDQHPAEFFAGLDRGKGTYALVASSKVFPSRVATVLAAMQGSIARYPI